MHKDKSSDSDEFVCAEVNVEASAIHRGRFYIGLVAMVTPP